MVFTDEQQGQVKDDLYYGLPFDQYLALPFPSQSGLKHGLESPAHMYAALTGGGFEPSDEMVTGTVLHEMVATGKTTAIVSPISDRRTRLYKDWAKSINASATIISDLQFVAARGMCDAIFSNPVAGLVLNADKRWHEISAIGTVSGVRCKARCDILLARGDDSYVVDIKSCRDASHFRFNRAAWGYGYHIQAAMYLELFDAESFTIIAVENKRPYDVTVFEPTPEWLQAGREDLARCLAIYKECCKSGSWPGRYDEPQSLVVPEWAEAGLVADWGDNG